jgi:hypothetical protein
MVTQYVSALPASMDVLHREAFCLLRIVHEKTLLVILNQRIKNRCLTDGATERETK